MYAETYFELNNGASLRKSQKAFIADVLFGCKYVSGISFIVEKVYRMSLFV